MTTNAYNNSNLGKIAQRPKNLGFLGDPSLDISKYIADYGGKPATEFESKQQITSRILDNQTSQADAGEDETFEYGDEFDVQDQPNYGPPGTGTTIINNEKVEHNDQPNYGPPGTNSSQEGGSNKSLTPNGVPPGAARAETGTFEDASRTSKSSKLTLQDGTTLTTTSGTYASQLSNMFCNVSVVYARNQNVKYSNTTGGGNSGTNAAGDLGDAGNESADSEWDAATNEELQEDILNALGIDDPSSIEGFEFGDSLDATFDNLRDLGYDVDGILAASNPLDVATAFLGANERNPANAAVLANFFEDSIGWDIDGPGLSKPQNAWCAAFANSVVQSTGLKPTGGLNAKSFLNWGQGVDISNGLGNVKPGDIAVFDRGTPGDWRGHVGFVQSVNADGTLNILGGNQNNTVSIRNYSTDRLEGIRRAKR